MGEDNSTTLYFYLSKVKSVLFVIAGFVFAPGGIAMCYTVLKMKIISCVYLVELLLSFLLYPFLSS